MNEPRTRCFLKAKIIFNDRRSMIECMVRNWSETGAKLEVDGSVSVPQSFELEVPAKGRTYLAEARWRDPDAVGIEFVADEAAPPTVPEDALAEENAQLKALVRSMAGRLRDLGEDVSADVALHFNPRSSALRPKHDQALWAHSRV